MLLRLIETKKEKIEAQDAFEACVTRAWRNREERIVAWRPNSREMEVAHNGKFGFGSVAPAGSDTTPRYWNPLGRYKAGGSLHIAVEINISTESNDTRVSVFSPVISTRT